MQQLKELILELSHNCNLACVMCGFGGQPVSRERFMSQDMLNRILSQVPSAPQAIRLNGRGESTIHPEFVAMADRVHAAFPDAVLNLFTNLSISRPAVIDTLLRHDMQLFVSLDSTDAAELEAIRRGCLQSVILANLDRLAGLDRRPFIVFTMQEANLHRIGEMARFARARSFHLLLNTIRRDEGIKPFVELVASRAEALRDTFAAIRALYEGSGLACLLPDQIHGIAMANGTVPTCGSRAACPALEQEICILANGDVTPCNMFNPFVFGNVGTTPLAEILAGSERASFRVRYKEHYYCANCACMGGTT